MRRGRPPNRLDEADRWFWERVDVRGEDECWPWLGARLASGHGVGTAQRKPYKAHRLAFSLANGKEAKGFVCHTCDNPPCCNPRHLYDGDAKSNADDRTRSGRRYPRAPEHRNSVLTAKQADEIRQSTDKTRALAKRYEVSMSTIYGIRAGTRYP